MIPTTESFCRRDEDIKPRAVFFFFFSDSELTDPESLVKRHKACLGQRMGLVGRRLDWFCWTGSSRVQEESLFFCSLVVCHTNRHNLGQQYLATPKRALRIMEFVGRHPKYNQCMRLGKRWAFWSLIRNGSIVRQYKLCTFVQYKGCDTVVYNGYRWRLFNQQKNLRIALISQKKLRVEYSPRW